MTASPDSRVAPEKLPRREWLLTTGIAVVLVLLATFVLLAGAGPEFSWDEADYAASFGLPWHRLWAHADYNRHGHGPLLIYLAKLGQDLLPAGWGTLETRLRFFDALVASGAVGVIYASLRHLFQTSRAAALAAASLFLFSGTRVEENNILGPHGLMTVCTLGLVALGYHWRNRPSLAAALGLAAVLVYGALTMSYVIPAAVCWAFAVAVGGRGWFGLDRTGFKVSWYVILMAAVALFVFAMLWPGGMNPKTYPVDFLRYVFFHNPCALVGNTFLEVVPRSAALYWMWELDPVLLVAAIAVLGLFGWRIYRGTPFTTGHVYLAASLFAIAAITLKAHLAGARNLLQLLAVLSLVVGAVFDEALGRKPRAAALWTLAIVLAAGLSLLWVVRYSSYTSALALDGYKALLRQNQPRLAEKVDAIVWSVPDVRYYSGVTGVPVAWKLHEFPALSIHQDMPLPPEVKYVLVPSYVYEGMPPDHPIRRVVAAHWKVVWSEKTDRVWELRLFERPDDAATP